MDKRRRQYVPLWVYFASGETGTRLLKKFGKDGLLAWVCFLAACKRGGVQGEFVYVTEEGGWGELGLPYPHTPSFTLDQFFAFTGQIKQTRKTRIGQVKHVSITRWGEWNKEWKKQADSERNASTEPPNAANKPLGSGGEAATELELELERETPLTPLSSWTDKNNPMLRFLRGASGELGDLPDRAIVEVLQTQFRHIGGQTALSLVGKWRSESEEAA